MSLRSTLQGFPAPTPPSSSAKERSQATRAGELAAQRYLEEGDWLPGTALRLAFSRQHGSQAVRRALEGSSFETQQRILQDFVGQVAGMLVEQYKCDLLKYFVSRYDERNAGYVVQELLDAGFDIDSQRHVELLSEVVRQSWAGDATHQLLSIAMNKFRDHWHKRYATCLFNAMLKDGGDDYRTAIMDGLVSAAQENWPGFSSLLRLPTRPCEVACVFLVSDVVATRDSRVDPLVTALVQDADLIKGLPSRRYGAILIKALLKAPDHMGRDIKGQLFSALCGLPERELLRLTRSLEAPCSSCAGGTCPECLAVSAWAAGLIGDAEQARDLER